MDLGVVILAGVYAAARRGDRVEEAWWGEYCREGRLGERGTGRGVQGKAEWLLWLSDGCQRAAAACREGGRYGQRRRARLRARAACLRTRARAAMHAAHHRIAATLTSQVDEVVIGDLDVVGLGRGRKGRNNRRLRFCAPARLRDAIKRAGTARGVEVKIVNEGGTTGTCPLCLHFAKHESEVRLQRTQDERSSTPDGLRTLSHPAPAPAPCLPPCPPAPLPPLPPLPPCPPALPPTLTAALGALR